jgi:hypothetical protein
MIDANVVGDINNNRTPGEICRQLILEGYPYLILPEPWCSVRAGERRDIVGDSHNLLLGEQAGLEDGSRIKGPDFAERLRELQQLCYNTIPSGDVLAELNRVDHFKDIKSTLGLMAGFLNGVGRRREAITVLGAWINSVISERLRGESINVLKLIESTSLALENILVVDGFTAHGSNGIFIHPNDYLAPDASCTIDICLFGHTRLEGTMEITNIKSKPVKFQMALHRKDMILSQYSQIVAPGRPVNFELSFDPIVGPIQLRLSTRMATNSGDNHFAWAIWRCLEFLATESP